jgi:hypothetical protein
MPRDIFADKMFILIGETVLDRAVVQLPMAAKGSVLQRKLDLVLLLRRKRPVWQPRKRPAGALCVSAGFQSGPERHGGVIGTSRHGFPRGWRRSSLSSRQSHCAHWFVSNGNARDRRALGKLFVGERPTQATSWRPGDPTEFPPDVVARACRA